MRYFWGGTCRLRECGDRNGQEEGGGGDGLGSRKTGSFHHHCTGLRDGSGHLVAQLPPLRTTFRWSSVGLSQERLPNLPGCRREQDGQAGGP